MELIVKPKPNNKFFKLGGREAGLVAWRASKKYSPTDEPDWAIFREWMHEYNLKHKRKITR